MTAASTNPLGKLALIDDAKRCAALSLVRGLVNVRAKTALRF